MINRRHIIHCFTNPLSFKRKEGAIALVIFLILSLLITHETKAQVRATGHVFAEIVEPTALTARPTNDHLVYDNGQNSDDDLILAEVKLSGGSDLNIDISIQTSSLEAENGETFFFDAFACPGCSEGENYSPAGEKIFTLKGTPQEIPKKKNSLFKGEYRVVFMYN